VVTTLTSDEDTFFVVDVINTYRHNAHVFTRESKHAVSLKFAASLCVHTHLLLRKGICVSFVLVFQD
jgi:hypothetical protein